MKKEFVIRGQTASGETEVLNFSGYKPGYAYRLVEFSLYPSAEIGTTSFQAMGSITAGKTAIAPQTPNFNDEGLIGTTLILFASAIDGNISESVLNDTFLITQNVILMVHEVNSKLVNWQCRFESVKMSGPEEAAANYKQFTISD